MPVYTLPDLPYDYADLAPYVSAEIMTLHHDKHHAAYVAGANAALEHLEEARDKNDFAAINQYSKDLAFNLAGHINHSIFWTNLTPDEDEPQGELAAAIKRDFGSFEAMKAQFRACAMGIQGSGWAILAYDTVAHSLRIFQLYDHQGNVPVGMVPLLLLDMWEHAFYIDYKNVKADYVDAFWHISNWKNVAERYENAVKKTDNLINL